MEASESPRHPLMKAVRYKRMRQKTSQAEALLPPSARPIAKKPCRLQDPPKVQNRNAAAQAKKICKIMFATLPKATCKQQKKLFLRLKDCDEGKVKNYKFGDRLKTMKKLVKLSKL